METLIILLLVLLIGVVLWMAWKVHDGQHKGTHLESLMNDKFNNFSQFIGQTMDNTRREVENSKDVLSRNAIETLKHLNSMSRTVSDLVAQQEKAQELGQSLEYLLRTPKLRGNYGETVLEEMLDRILPKGIWQRQYQIEGSEKVDAVVLYRDVVVPIDSKFPREHYQRYLETSDEKLKKKYWSEYEKALKVQINSISEKYIKPEKGTTEFALLFIPSESIYYETIAETNFIGDPCQINEYATGRKVIPVSPNSFYAFLHVVLLGVRNIEIVREAKKLQDSLVKVERDFDYFYKMYGNIGKNIEKAGEAFRKGDNHIRRFKRNLDNTLSIEDNIGSAAEEGFLEKEKER
jgi:DNA recombination protein RmuC